MYVYVCVDISLDPVLVNVPLASDKKKMSCVSFAHNTDCVLAGDSNGQVTVFQLCGLTTPSDSQVTSPAVNQLLKVH